MKYISNSCDDTERIAYEFSKNLGGGEIITLDGDLGAGKTAFVRGLARGLDVSEVVSSPTFTIVNEYRSGRVPVFHFDVYRLSSPDEMYDIGWDDYITQNAVVVIEWASIISDIFVEKPISVNIRKNPDKGEDYREIIIEGAAL